VSLSSGILNVDILTTLKAGDMDGNLLPWKLPQFLYQLKSFLSAKRFVSWPPRLTVFCLTLVKKRV